MNPDKVIARLTDELKILVTRRTLLQYEIDNRISKPWFETGKAKEYHDEVVAEFVASWCLNHGEYGVRAAVF